MGIVRTLKSQRYLDPELGAVNLRVLSTATRYTARWKADALHITIPAGTTLEAYERTMADWKPRLLEIRPVPKAAKYYPGFRFETDDWQFEIVASRNMNPLSVTSRYMGSEPKLTFNIYVHPDYDFSSVSGQTTVSDLICRVAARVAEVELLMQADDVARELGLTGRVRSFSVGRGMKRLGCCDGKRNISLSRVLMFLPRELRRSTITHELAHLDHMDHSPAFYALWDRYLGYPHTVSRAKINEFDWPIVR